MCKQTKNVSIGTGETDPNVVCAAVDTTGLELVPMTFQSFVVAALEYDLS